MEKFLLILTLTSSMGNSPPFNVVEMPSADACQLTGEAFIKDMKLAGYGRARYFCIRKYE